MGFCRMALGFTYSLGVTWLACVRLIGRRKMPFGLKRGFLYRMTSIGHVSHPSVGPRTLKREVNEGLLADLMGSRMYV